LIRTDQSLVLCAPEANLPVWPITSGARGTGRPLLWFALPCSFPEAGGTASVRRRPKAH